MDSITIKVPTQEEANIRNALNKITRYHATMAANMLLSDMEKTMEPEISCRTCLACVALDPPSYNPETHELTGWSWQDLKTYGECRRHSPTVNPDSVIGVWPLVLLDAFCLDHITEEDLEEDEE